MSSTSLGEEEGSRIRRSSRFLDLFQPRVHRCCFCLRCSSALQAATQLQEAIREAPSYLIP